VLKKFPHLFLVLVIEGGALMAVELMGAKLVAPFYGGSLYVWTAVLTITVLGLTLGYYAGGRLSKKRPSEKMLFIILGISALLVLALPLTASIAIALTMGMGLIIGICITCALLLLPPMFCFGMVGPIVVALMSSQLETVGKTAGTVYFTSTLGGIAATFFLGLYFIPVAGLRFCATITGLALAALPVIYIVKKVLDAWWIVLSSRRWHMDRRTRKRWIGFSEDDGKVIRKRASFQAAKPQPVANALKTTRSTLTRRDKAIPATAKRSKVPSKKPTSKGRRGSGVKGRTVKRTIYLFAVLEGATVMAVELLSARMIAPYFGSSLYVWGTVIGFTLLALAIGYFAGGVVADNSDDPHTLLWVLLVASAFLMLMPVSSQWLTIAFVNIIPGAAIILVSLILILPPLLFLGMVPTFLIRKLSARADSAGSNTGVVYAISSASGIVALPVFGFLVIPQHGLTTPSIITGLAVGLIPFVKLIARQRYISLGFIPVVLFSFWATKTHLPGKAVNVQYYSEGLLGQLLVADVSKDRFLFVNRTGQTWVDKETFKPKWDYASYVKSICSKFPEKSNALILGLGGGTVANIFQNTLGFNVDAVELDRRIAEVAKQYFALDSKVNVVVDDARHYLEEIPKKYDVILFDVYRGEAPPPHVFTLESLTKTKSLLKEDGLIIVNFNGFWNGKTGQAARSIYKTLLAAGLKTRILPTLGDEAGRNILFVASSNKQDFRTVRSPLEQYGKQVNIETLFQDPDKADVNDAVVLTDDKPILELLNIRAGNEWRKGYIEMTKTFYKEGIPLFR
jgi:predicted membrane-bound spermidine synthase